MFSHLGIAIIHDSPERHPRGENFGLDLPLLFSLHEIWSVDSLEISLKLLPSDVIF